ncbi:hypothetical protein [Pseudomonas sp. S36]|uniref:hypothetical protein n=1 Tax=Pseudomonas sp. S36 TaxID=2767447 RepID=UPI0019122391|nr:hypothetical protein [Pseudomonas sp. S36]MBK4987903.1 hypothetical protein [Pseudomonas sp. S36]
MNRNIAAIALLAGALAISGPAAAHGRGWAGPGPLLGAAVVGAVIGATAYGGHDRTVYVERPPVYYAPPPVYVQPPPQPVYYQPYYAPAPPPPPGYRAYYGPPPVYYGPPRW